MAKISHYPYFPSQTEPKGLQKAETDSVIGYK